MSARLLMTLAAAVFVCGCSNVEMVTTENGDTGLREVNRAVRGNVVRMKTRDGRTIHAVGVHVAADSVSWVNRKSNMLETIPTSSVREVSVHKTGMGAVRGLLFGAVVGAAFGGVRATMEGDDPLSDPLAITREEKLRIFPAAHALYASLVTTPIGAIIGTRKVYRFDRAGSAMIVRER